MFIIILAISSALDRPYRQTAEVIRRLQQEGIAILVVSTAVFSGARQLIPRHFHHADACQYVSGFAQSTVLLLITLDRVVLRMINLILSIYLPVSPRHLNQTF